MNGFSLICGFKKVRLTSPGDYVGFWFRLRNVVAESSISRRCSHQTAGFDHDRDKRPVGTFSSLERLSSTLRVGDRFAEGVSVGGAH